MKVLLVGVGGVGEAIAVMAKMRPWLEKMVLANYSLERAKTIQAKLGDPEKFPVEQLDASNVDHVILIARKHQVDLLMNAVSVEFDAPLFEAAYQAGCIYMNMAMGGLAADMGREEFALHDKWAEKGLLAIRATGADPGMSDVFARYAQYHLFDEVEEIGVRDGATLAIEGYPFASTVAPTGVVAACLSGPAELSEHMRGKTCVGTWVKGTKDGLPRQVYLYQSTEHAFCMEKYSCQAVSWQTGVNPYYRDGVASRRIVAGKKCTGL